MSQPSWIGHEIGGRYLIEEMIGQGGMSTVYKATDPNLRRTVAVKLIHGHLSSNPEFVRRFGEEAAAVAQLSHPNIIQVFDFDNEDETYYMILEYLLGESMQERLKRVDTSGRQMSLIEALEIMAGTCDAVDYAHKRGMIHRDIKPANIMITTQGQAKLMDFGVVKMIGSKQHTATGAVIGTALYMSPEQARGEHPDERADIYSLGVTLFEMVSGRPPFEADSAMTTMMMHLNDPVPDIRELNPGTPDALKSIIDRALSKDAADRYQTAGAMGSALRDVLGQLKGAPAGATMLEEPGMEAAPPEATLLETPAPEEVDAEGTLLEAPPAAPQAKPAPAATQPSSATEAQIPQPVPQAQASEAAPARARSGLPLAALLGGGALLAIVAIVVVGVLVLGGGGGGASGTDAQPEGEPAGEEAAPVAEVAPTEAPVPTAAPTEPPPPTDVPTPAFTPTPEVPPGVPFVRINSITLDGNTYVVTYETFEYQPALPGTHIHFFFDTVPPENAGVPGAGPWFLYGGPSPFTGYTVVDRPASAVQMCSLVANPDHSVQANSGNCVDLP